MPPTKKTKRPVAPKVAAKTTAKRPAAKAAAQSPRKASKPKPAKPAVRKRKVAAATKGSASRASRASALLPSTESHKHDDQAVQRPDVGVQHRFAARKPRKTYRYDSSLDPALSWDENASRDLGDWLIGLIDRVATEGETKRLFIGKNQLRFKRYITDFPYKEVTNWWDGLGGANKPIYVVQTNTEIVKRCLLIATKPGDLVIDPTCGSGTTAYVAEQWGRRWITCDTSRVPLALARQRLLTATFPYFGLKDQKRGPQGGFVYTRKQNQKREEIGGLVPHITSSSMANDEMPAMEVLVVRPEIVKNVTRVSGPFVVEATLPATMDYVAEDSGNIGVTANKRIAVKVIDERGNELMVVKDLI